MFSKVGLTNKSVDPSRQRLCTINTILQFLFNIPLFRETILQKVVPPSSSSSSSKSGKVDDDNAFSHPVFALQHVFHQMKTASSSSSSSQEESSPSSAAVVVVNSKMIIDSIPGW